MLTIQYLFGIIKMLKIQLLEKENIMATKIIVDSTADLIDSLKERVQIVPLTINFGDKEYADGVDINHKMFYEMLIESDVLPTTSQATPAKFTEVFEQISPDDDAIVITLSQKLSGTYQSATIAAEDFDNVYVVDSNSVAIGLGILVEYALHCVESGMSAKEIVDALNEKKKKVCLIALLDTLEYLKKGGRISSTVAFAGGLLNIKPVISVKDGEITMLGKARGSKQGNNLLVQEIEKAGGIDFKMPILLGFTGLSDIMLKKYIEDSGHLWKDSASQLNYTTIGSVVGTHTGPNVVAAAFFTN